MRIRINYLIRQLSYSTIFSSLVYVCLTQWRPERIVPPRGPYVFYVPVYAVCVTVRLLEPVPPARPPAAGDRSALWHLSQTSQSTGPRFQDPIPSMAVSGGANRRRPVSSRVWSERSKHQSRCQWTQIISKMTLKHLEQFTPRGGFIWNFQAYPMSTSYFSSSFSIYKLQTNRNSCSLHLQYVSIGCFFRSRKTYTLSYFWLGFRQQNYSDRFRK